MGQAREAPLLDLVEGDLAAGRVPLGGRDVLAVDGVDLLIGDDTVDEPDPERLLRVDEATREHEVLRTGRADEAMDHLKQAVAIFAEVGEPGRLQPEIWRLVDW